MMAKSTAPILGVAGITLFNDVVIRGSAFTDELRVIAATGISLIAFTALEKVNAQFAAGLAYVALITAIVAPLGKDNTSFIQRASTWFASSGVGS